MYLMKTEKIVCNQMCNSSLIRDSGKAVFLLLSLSFTPCLRLLVVVMIDLLSLHEPVPGDCPSASGQLI